MPSIARDSLGYQSFTELIPYARSREFSIAEQGILLARARNPTPMTSEV